MKLTHSLAEKWSVHIEELVCLRRCWQLWTRCRHMSILRNRARRKNSQLSFLTIFNMEWILSFSLKMCFYHIQHIYIRIYIHVHTLYTCNIYVICNNIYVCYSYWGVAIIASPFSNRSFPFQSLIYLFFTAFNRQLFYKRNRALLYQNRWTNF